jgi:hypothetical protein
VTQEVVRAWGAEVHCRIDAISWSDIVAAQDMIANDHFQSLVNADCRHPNLYLIQSFVSWRSQTLLPRPLDNATLPEPPGMLELSYNTHTSNYKDRIYGIIGLTRARNDERLQIDYSKSIHQLFLGVFKYIILMS